MHTDAVQAVGALPVDFAASGVDALTVTGHKLGGPFGVGRAAARAATSTACRCCTAAGRSATCAPAPSTCPARSRAFAVGRRDRASDASAEHAAGVAAPARRPGRAGCSRRVPDAVLNGDPPGAGRLPGIAHFSFPGCEGDSLLMLLDARGIECSTGSACSAGVAQPTHVLLAMGADEARARGSLRFSLGHTSTAADVDALSRLARRDRARRAVVSGPVERRHAGRGRGA